MLWYFILGFVAGVKKHFDFNMLLIDLRTVSMLLLYDRLLLPVCIIFQKIQHAPVKRIICPLVDKRFAA